MCRFSAQLARYGEKGEYGPGQTVEQGPSRSFEESEYLGPNPWHPSVHEVWEH